MGSNIAPGNFEIVSLVGGRASVNLTLPAFQEVYIDGPVTKWVVEPDGKTSYRLSVGEYPYTGADENVIASIHSEQNLHWLAIYQAPQNAYTISPVNDLSKGWTVAEPSNPNSVIKLELILMQPSEPPQFSIAQLFRFEPL